jgi:hypothetical protein
MSSFLRKYATATASGTHVGIPMVKAGSNDFAVAADWTVATGDVKLSIDGGAQANIGTLPTYTNGQWVFVFTALELTGKSIRVAIVDSATKAVEDQYFAIETYGNASALHAFDLGTALTPLTVLPANSIDEAAIADGAINSATFASGTTIPRVTLADTLTTYTGNTPQSGDAYARIGASGAGLTAVGDTAGTTTLLTRLSNARAGFLDNLNVGGNVASSAEATAIQNNTRVVRVVPPVIERPDSGTVTYRIELLLYDAVGNMEAPDAAPTIDVVNQAGTSLNTRLDSTTMTLVSTGRYRSIYTASVGDALEQLVWAFSVIEGGATRVYGNTSVIVDTTAVDFTAADRTKLDALEARIPGTVQPQTGDAYARLGANGAGLTALAPASTALSNATWTDAKAAFIDASILSRSTYAGGAVASVTATVNATLVATGLDAIPSTLTAAPTTFPQWIVWIAHRLGMRKVIKDATTIKVYADNNTTVITTNAFTSVSGVDTIQGYT